jgi:hypothetical protein
MFVIHMMMAPGAETCREKMWMKNIAEIKSCDWRYRLVCHIYIVIEAKLIKVAISDISQRRKNFWEYVIEYFPLIRHELHRNRLLKSSLPQETVYQAIACLRNTVSNSGCSAPKDVKVKLYPCNNDYRVEMLRIPHCVDCRQSAHRWL